jgi:uncharacterized membrane protein YgcG
MPKTKAPTAPAQISRRAMLGKIALFAGAAYAAPAMLSLSQARASGYSGGGGSSYSGGTSSNSSYSGGGGSSYSGSRGSSNSSFSNAGQRSRWPTWWQRS